MGRLSPSHPPRRGSRNWFTEFLPHWPPSSRGRAGAVAGRRWDKRGRTPNFATAPCNTGIELYITRILGSKYADKRRIHRSRNDFVTTTKRDWLCVKFWWMGVRNAFAWRIKPASSDLSWLIDRLEAVGKGGLEIKHYFGDSIGTYSNIWKYFS